MKYGYSERNDDIAKRLNRIEGQVRGIGGMVGEDRYCIDILTQIAATRAALDKVGLELLREHTKHCLADPTVGPKTIDKKTDELIATISRMITN
jgi:DNA-binding FrmR family transcriptional regulator